MFTIQSTIQFPRAMGTQKTNENSIPHSDNFNDTNLRQTFYNHGRQEQHERQVQHEQPQQKQSSIDAGTHYNTPQQRSSSRISLTENTTTTSYTSPPMTYYNVTRPNHQNIQPPYSGSIIKYPYPYPYSYPYSYPYPCPYPYPHPYPYPYGNQVPPQTTGPSTLLNQSQNDQQFQPQQQYHYQGQPLPAPSQQFYSYPAYPSQYPKLLPGKSTIQGHYKSFQPLPAYLNEKIKQDSSYIQNNSPVKNLELFPNVHSSLLFPQQQQLQSHQQMNTIPLPQVAQQQHPFKLQDQKQQPKEKKQRRLTLGQPGKDRKKLDQKRKPNLPKSSSIAGVVYNSSAVYKRLKLSSSIEKEETEKINKTGSTLKSQGRPFSGNINSRFLMHVGLCSLLSYADKKSKNEFVIYNYSKNGDDCALKNIDNNSDKNSGQNADIKDKENDEKEKAEDANLLNMEMLLDGAMDKKANFKISIESLDSFLNFRNQGTLKIEGQKTLWNPIQNIICYSASSNNKKESLEMKRNNLDTPVSFLLNNDSQITENETTCDTKINFHTLIVKKFDLEKYNFVKTIRDNSGHILKLESIKPPTNGNGEIEYSAEWVKRRICYPRYKSGMNIHLLETQENFILYNDIKMFLWDIKEDILHDDDPELTELCIKKNKISEKTKNKLFGDKVVYVNLRYFKG